MNEFISMDVQCPYFVSVNSGKGASGYAITCEGICGAKYNTSRFTTSKERETYLKCYCNQYPNKCSIAKAIEEKYME